MFTAEEILAGLVMILSFIVFFVLLVFFVNFTNSIECRNKYASFENKYSYWEKCQIKINDKWIPADSYYFKEE